MRTGPVLASEPVERYQPLGAFGQPVYLSHVQLRATILQKLGARHANYFARPDEDPQNKRLHWIAELPGRQRRWTDLSESEQALAALDLHALRSDFLRYLDELRAAASAGPQGQGATAFASLLEQAMLVPDDSHLHFVGDQPVVSFWGFRGFEKPPVDPLAVAPSKPVAPNKPAAAPPTEGVAISPAAASPVGLKPRRPWWHWLLLGLLALLLLLLLLFGLSRCWQDDSRIGLFGSPPVTDGTQPPPDLQQPGRPDQVRPPEEGGIVGWTRRLLGLDQGDTGDVIVRPDGTILRPDGTVVRPDGTVVLGPDGKPVEGNVPGAGLEAAKPSGTDAPEAPSLPTDEPSPDKLPPDPLPPGQLPPDAQTGRPPVPDPSAPGQPPMPRPDGSTSAGPDQAGKGAPLQLPPDGGKSGDVGFLGGEWNSQSGLIDQTTKQPLQQTYRFDEKGTGEVTIRRADGALCRAPAQARMQGGRLSIQETGDPTCPDGRTYSRSQTECTRTPGGQTVCQGRNADGSTYRVGIQKQP